MDLFAPNFNIFFAVLSAGCPTRVHLTAMAAVKALFTAHHLQDGILLPEGLHLGAVVRKEIPDHANPVKAETPEDLLFAELLQEKDRLHQPNLELKRMSGKEKEVRVAVLHHQFAGTVLALHADVPELFQDMNVGFRSQRCCREFFSLISN